MKQHKPSNKQAIHRKGHDNPLNLAANIVASTALHTDFARGLPGGRSIRASSVLKNDARKD
jgi:hypothetical protein